MTIGRFLRIIPEMLSAKPKRRIMTKVRFIGANSNAQRLTVTANAPNAPHVQPRRLLIRLDGTHSASLSSTTASGYPIADMANHSKFQAGLPLDLQRKYTARAISVRIAPQRMK